MYRCVYSVCIILVLFSLCSSCSAQNTDNNEGLDCDAKNFRGTCKLAQNCPNADLTQTCGTKNGQPLVCCQGKRPLGQVSDEFCTSYSQSLWVRKKVHYTLTKNISLCARPNSKPLVTEGEVAKPKEFPHQVLLGYGEDDHIVWVNGGSLISEYFVLTAAHCVETQANSNVTWVRLGDLNIDSTSDVADPKEFRILQIYEHPLYVPPRHYHDIALLRIDGPAKFNQFIAPICLQTTLHEKTRYLATGWGYTRRGGSPSSTLMSVILDDFQNDECNKAHEQHIKLHRRKFGDGILDKYQVCAGSRDSGKDTCQGDSGGPLQIYNKNPHQTCTYKLIGITSFGVSCGVKNKPGVYTRVSGYIGWIEEHVWPQ